MIKLKSLTILFVLTILIVMAGGHTPNALASPGAVVPNLGSAASFVGLSSAALTNTGSGIFIGDVGSATAVTGFPPGTIINGSIAVGGPIVTQALVDASAAYNNLQGQVCTVHLTGQDLGGMILAPGVYCFDSSAQLTGDLVLDAQYNRDAVWVFQTGSTLTTATDATVTMIHSGNILNAFWQIGSSATLGTGTRFIGSIIANTSITLVTGATLSGRAIALTGKVDMDTNGSPFPLTNNPPSIFIWFPFLSTRR